PGPFPPALRRASDCARVLSETVPQLARCAANRARCHLIRNKTPSDAVATQSTAEVPRALPRPAPPCAAAYLSRNVPTHPQVSAGGIREIGRASCRERVRI